MLHYVYGDKTNRRAMIVPPRYCRKPWHRAMLLTPGVPAMRKLLSKQQVLELVPYSSTHIGRLEKDGLFPGRLKRGNGGRNARAFWYADEIVRWIEEDLSRYRE